MQQKILLDMMKIPCIAAKTQCSQINKFCFKKKVLLPLSINSQFTGQEQPGILVLLGREKQTPSLFQSSAIGGRKIECPRVLSMTRLFCGLWTLSSDASGQTNCKAVKQNFLPPSSAVLRYPWTQVLKPEANAPEGRLCSRNSKQIWNLWRPPLGHTVIGLCFSSTFFTRSQPNAWQLHPSDAAIASSSLEICSWPF